MENLKKHLFSSSRSTGATEPRSVFHIDNTDYDNLKKEVQECFESVEEFSNAAKNLDGAGTHLTESLTKALKQTQHRGLAEDCGAAFREVYASDQTAFVACQLQDMSSVLVDLKTKMEVGASDNVTAEYAQSLCKVLLLFVRTQHAYHKLYSDKMLGLMKKLKSSKRISNQAEVNHDLLTLVLTSAETSQLNEQTNSSPLESPKGSPKVKKSSKNPGSPKSLTKQTFKSSLFSLFERKPSPEESKSAFYVDSAAGSVDGSDTEVHAARSTGSSDADLHCRSPSEQTANVFHSPHANLHDQEPSGQGHPRSDCLPKVTITCQDRALTSSGMSRGQSGDCPPSGQGHYSSAVGQGHMLIDFIGHPGGCDTAMGPTSAPPSNSLPMIDPGSMQLSLGMPPQIAAGLAPVDGQLATEEDLDCVINLLSAGNTSTSPMQAIPENQVQGQVQLAVPQLYRMPSPASDTNVDEMKNLKFQMHRRSEGCLDLTGVRGNTWPHQHRSSLPAVQTFPQRQAMDPHREPAAFMQRYSQEMHLPFRPNAAYQGQGHGQGSLMPGSQWSFPASGTWPSMQAHAGSDTMNSSWSGVQDSSDLSDDSSSGEQFYAVGRDLVQAINLHDDSSDDDGERRRRVPLGSAGLDSHDQSSVNTWPPKQQWSQSNLYLNSGLEPLEPHRPVQMQWSDPMPSRNLWPIGPPLGLLPQRTSQSMQGFETLQ